MSSLRDIRQQEFADLWIERDERGILNLCPRFGKIYTAINIMEKIKPTSILIAYPDRKIEQSWKEDFKKRKFVHDNITFTTHLSIHKYKENKYDLVIIDEVHLLSEAQIEACNDLFENNDKILALTGTLSKWTERVLREDLNLRIVGRYSIERAIKEGVLPDYEIRIVKVPLDNRIQQLWKNKKATEKRRFDNYMWVIKKKEKEGKDAFFLKLRIIDVLQRSLAKMNTTIALIKKFENERVLVFCGRTDIADKLGIPSYHSKSEDKELWESFVAGDINHMAVVKIGNTGVTYKPLSKVIINAFDSNSENMTQKINRCMSLEYNNPDKKAIIYVITSDEEIEIKWLNKSLSMFEKSKIKYL
jgi:superfamily II DNA or RNA helicase